MGVAAAGIVDHLRRSILTGALAPGTRLGEAELGARLGVSRTPIREALRTLSSQGLVEVNPNRGARVAQWSVEDLAEIYDLRIMLEGYAAHRAATLISSADVGQLAALCEEMESCAERGGENDLLRLSELNSRFHQCIVENAVSPRLATILASVVQVPLVVRTFARYSPESLTRSMGHHRELTAAMRAGAADWAQSVMCSHIMAARSVLLASAEPLGLEDASQ